MSDAGTGLLAEMVEMDAALLVDGHLDALGGIGSVERSVRRVGSRKGHCTRGCPGDLRPVMLLVRQPTTRWRT